jgi:acetoin utilization deacetylase AcuC-like enzyme
MGVPLKIYYTDHFVLPLPAGHRFPMEKYALLRERVLEAGIVPPHELLEPLAATDDELRRVHDATYVERVVDGALAQAEVRRIGFPWSPALVERSRRSVGATIAAARAALADGWGINLAGGTHHAFADHGEGFCVFNDVAVAARAMQAERKAGRIAIVDCDVHQGNGTAAIFAADADVFTFSVHAAANFPFIKAGSDLDIALPDATGDARYLAAVSAGLDAVLAKPVDLVFHVAGADPFDGDRLGRLAVSKEGLATRDRLVFDRCMLAGTPVAVVMSGGYARSIGDTVAIHAQTVLEASSRAWPTAAVSSSR